MTRALSAGQCFNQFYSWLISRWTRLLKQADKVYFLKFNLTSQHLCFSFYQYMGHKYTRLWDSLLLLIRIWLGYAMIRNGNSVLSIFTSADEREFFRHWFGDELHFPFPVLMATLAKGSEFFGGILLGLGLFTSISSSFIAFTMLVATLTANLGENFNIDGGFTISYCLLALIFVLWGGGRYSLDYVFFKRYRNNINQTRTQ